MKKLAFIFFVLVSFVALSQPGLDRLLATNPSGLVKESEKEHLASLIHSLSASGIPEQKLLRRTFHRIQTTFLKEYEAYSGFNDIFSSGRYDCLTATALFTYVLGQLNYSFDIIETNYHIFIIVKTSRGEEILLETTDRIGGFVTEESAITKRIGDYRKNLLVADNSNRVYYRYSFDLYQKISVEKLTGLLYFNQAVRAFNHRDWTASSKALEKANTLYASPRCEELGAILIHTVFETSLDEKTKADCLGHLKDFWLKKSETIAFD